ncbi:hypothetical protein BK816_06475 [Boudabousia tangfeifanii]|uniref:G5 domain-containing protein n=1 Tax=Boudabousia tangfeifanii TaxID=1912795 RepID=A0A1D9MKZ0_9ACTO|nr:ubiquitin-like domain-containing protein [Boudabousia tangfeifanii]AOZ72977.1 hypothetical protein BK816_06475 [Boudabousia tangfeifanii]
MSLSGMEWKKWLPGPQGWQPNPRIVWSVAAVSAAAVIGLSASQISAAHHDVTLEVDGVSRPVSVFGNQVAQALDAAGVELAPHDQVTPALDSRLLTGSRISVSRAKNVSVKVGQNPITLWTTASSSDELLSDLAARGHDTMIAASRGESRPELETLANRKVNATINADGNTTEVVIAPGKKIDEVLASAKIQLSPLDQVDLAKNGSKMTIDVHRVTRGNFTEEAEIPFKTIEKEDPRLWKGEEKVANEGIPGRFSRTIYRETRDGQVVVETEVERHEIAAPVDKMVLKGTKEKAAPPTLDPETGDLLADVPVPESITGTTPASAKLLAKGMVAQQGWSNSEFQCLEKLWTRESNWNYRSLNRSSGAYGIPQSLPGNKMASAGPDWRTNPATQIKWGLGYIKGRYGTPCNALGHSYSHNWY